MAVASRALNENVISQGLFYLDWLMDHQAEFTLQVMTKLGRELSEKIDWYGGCSASPATSPGTSNMPFCRSRAISSCSGTADTGAISCCWNG
jgi:hypothetical protein